MIKKEDFTGKTFWKWSVIRFSGKIWRKSFWLCKCECWNEKSIYSSHLKSNKSTNCWCVKAKNFWDRFRTHWMSNTRIYGIRCNIVSRCNNNSDKSTDYKYYWWRGIKVERNNFEEFYKDMKEWYDDKLTIDRIDNNWNYCKENCRRVSRKVQANNMRTNHLVEIDWETHNLSEWAIIKGKNYNTIRSRINFLKRDAVKAITT